MQDKRRWLPRWQRVELVQKCLEEGLTRRQAAAYRQASEADRARAIAFFASHGITIERWQTDNAFVYTKNTAFHALLAAHSIRHRTIPPRMPKRNGKVERYQQTLKREWGLGQRYRSSDARAAAPPHWLHHYNHERNHSSLGNRPPITRVRSDPRHNN
jgi:transposase InsO family protein